MEVIIKSFIGLILTLGLMVALSNVITKFTDIISRKCKEEEERRKYMKK